jgi:hypothetical protein
LQWIDGNKEKEVERESLEVEEKAEAITAQQWGLQ